MPTVLDSGSWVSESEVGALASEQPRKEEPWAVDDLETPERDPDTAAEAEFINTRVLWSRDLEEAIERSKRMLKFKPYTDDRGSGISSETLSRTEQFLRLQMTSAARVLGLLLAIPRINPAEHDSLDLYWGSSRRYLLVNVPSTTNDPITYFGEAPGRTIGGSMTDSETRLELTAWLSELG